MRIPGWIGWVGISLLLGCSPSTSSLHLNPIGFQPHPLMHKSNQIAYFSISIEKRHLLDLLTQEEVYQRLRQAHPVDDKITPYDLRVLTQIASDQIEIYYLQLEPSVTPEEMLQFAKQQLQCSPLGNDQLSFLLKSNELTPFRPRPRHHLILALDQFMVEEGFTPIEPQTLSPYLAQRFQIPAELPLDQRNLTQGIAHQVREGYLFCGLKRHE